MSFFDADAFARKLQASYARSKYKSYTELAKAAQSNKASISRYMNAAKQTNTDKPSQPKPELVVSIAKAFNENEDDWLLSAGYAALASHSHWTERVRVALLGVEDMTEDEIERAVENIEIFVAGVRASRKQKRESKRE